MTVWMKSTRWTVMTAALSMAAVSMATSSCGFHHAKYENPITKDTQQPDKALYDKAVKDLQRGHYELSRLTLNTLINTYDSSEYLAKAKLAIADSWYREGGASGLAQAEAEYKDFELFYPTMPEAAESQYKICKLHFEQMSKPDRDSNQALRAERECKQVVLQFPNSKFIPDTEQLLREIDEVMAEGEMRSANFYYQKGSRAAAANRFMGLVDQYPLYSRADEALWKGADAYLGMGPRLRARAGQALQKIVREYPLGLYAELAKKKLRELELEVPAADPAAVARMKYEQENRTKQSAFRSATAFLRPGPDVTTAAKTGSPAMNAPKQTVPANVPEPAVSGAAGFQGDVTVSPVANGAGATPGAGATASVDGAKPQGDAAPAAATQATADKASADAASTATAKDKKKKDKKDKKNQKQTQAPDPNASANQSPAPSPDQTPKP